MFEKYFLLQDLMDWLNDNEPRFDTAEDRVYVCARLANEIPAADVVPVVRWKGADTPPEDGAYVLVDSIRFGVAEARYQAGISELDVGAIWSVCREHGDQLSDDDILGWMPLPPSNSGQRRENK